jgi:hypothetical protein
VTGVFVQDWNTIRDKDAYIILTTEEGVVFKVVENKIKSDAKLVLHSLNPAYEPFDILAKDIREMWQFINFISSEIPENEKVNQSHLLKTVQTMKQEIKVIQAKLEL